MRSLLSAPHRQARRVSPEPGGQGALTIAVAQHPRATCLSCSTPGLNFPCVNWRPNTPRQHTGHTCAQAHTHMAPCCPAPGQVSFWRLGGPGGKDFVFTAGAINSPASGQTRHALPCPGRTGFGKKQPSSYAHVRASPRDLHGCWRRLNDVRVGSRKASRTPHVLITVPMPLTCDRPVYVSVKAAGLQCRSTLQARRWGSADAGEHAGVVHTQASAGLSQMCAHL